MWGGDGNAIDLFLWLSRRTPSGVEVLDITLFRSDLDVTSDYVNNIV